MESGLKSFQGHKNNETLNWNNYMLVDSAERNKKVIAIKILVEKVAIWIFGKIINV